MGTINKTYSIIQEQNKNHIDQQFRKSLEKNGINAALWSIIKVIKNILK